MNETGVRIVAWCFRYYSTLVGLEVYLFMFACEDVTG